MTFDECNAGRQTEIAQAVETASRRLNSAAGLLGEQPLQPGTENALFLMFRDTSTQMAQTVGTNLRKIAAGLKRAQFQCVITGGDFRCEGAHAFVPATGVFIGFGDIHICLEAWETDSPAVRVHTLIHEGAHRFLSARHTVGDYTTGCEDTLETAGNRGGHLGNADSYACVVSLLHDVTDATLDFRVKRLKGQALLGIVQGPKGPVDLDSTDARRPSFTILEQGLDPGVRTTADTPGMKFRWFILAGSESFEMVDENGGLLDPSRFGANASAHIAGFTRARIKARGVREASVTCIAAPPAGGQRTFTLPIEFATTSKTACLPPDQIPALTGAALALARQGDELPESTGLEGLIRGDGLIFGTFDRRPRVVRLQSRLGELGAAIAPDGMFGDRTATELRQFQSRHALPEADHVDQATANALESASPEPGEPAPLSQLEGLTLNDGITFGTFERRPRVRALQDRLTAHTFPCAIDGMFGPETAGSLTGFQRSRGLPESTTVDRATADALEDRDTDLGAGAPEICPAGTVPVATSA